MKKNHEIRRPARTKHNTASDTQQTSSDTDGGKQGLYKRILNWVVLPSRTQYSSVTCLRHQKN